MLNKTPFKMNYSELSKMNIEELKALNSQIVSLIKLKRYETTIETKSELRVGMNVSVNHPKLAGKQLRVEKINRTKASLKVLNGFGSYNVPISMIQING